MEVCTQYEGREESNGWLWRRGGDARMCRREAKEGCFVRAREGGGSSSSTTEQRCGERDGRD